MQSCQYDGRHGVPDFDVLCLAVLDDRRRTLDDRLNTEPV
jgi:hypothetical protein